MKITSKLFLTALLAGAAAFGASAQETVTITVDNTTGTLTRDGAANTWCNIWASNATNPGVTVTSTKNDMQWDASGVIDARSGQALTETFTVASTTAAWIVQSYSINCTLAGTSDQTITAGDKSETVTSEGLTWSDTNNGTTSALSFTISGPNTGVLLNDFTVTLAPNPNFTAAFVPTTIVDGEFAPGTNWYTIQIAAAGLHWTYVEGATQMNLTSPTTKLDDADLWCFVGDPEGTFQVYNKAAGAGKMFSAPTAMLGTTGGSSYAIVQAPEADGYCYDWNLRETTVLGTDTRAFFMNEDGEQAKTLNNRSNILAFWNAGADAGSAIQITWAEQTIDINPSEGTFYRFDAAISNPAWCSKFVSSANTDFALSTVKNNMYWLADGTIQLASGMEWGPWSFTCPKNTYVYAYGFDFQRNGDWGTATMTITSDCFDTDYEVTDEYQTLSVSGLTAEQDPDFTLNATPANANKAINVKNFKVTIRRTVEKQLGTMIFRYDGTPGYTVCYRIPSILTVENGAHKGRLVAINDYRYCGGDIGAGRIDLYHSVSDDNGLTWSEPDHLRDANGNPVAEGDNTYNADCAFGDAASVSDRESGKILVIAVGGHVNFFASRRNAPNQCFRWYSEDGGDTWTQGENITEQILSLFDGEPSFGKIDGQFFGSGRIMQSRKVKVGDYYRLYAVLSSQNNGGNTRNWALYSDDFGKTWSILGGVPCVAATADEPKAEELPDGSVLLAARRNGSNRHFNIFRYTDIEKGEGSWSSPVATDMGMGTINACDGEIMILPVRNKETQEQCYLALQSFPYGGGRNKVSIAWKPLDDAADIATPSAFTTWNGRYQVSKMGSAYSTMTWQHDNTLGFLYEESTYGKDYCGIYRNLTVEEITGDAYEYYPDEDGSVAKSLTDALIDYRLETEAPKGEAGEYVGQPDGLGNPEAEEAAANYKENPTLDNYLLFNKAIVSGGGYISIKNGGVYVLKSAHNGAYTFGDRWLTSNGSKLMSVSAPTEETVFVFVHQPAESDNWVIYHPSTKSFVPQSPSAVETAFSMTLDPALAHEYMAESTSDGYTHFTDVNPGHATYGTIHQGGNQGGHIVIWTKDSQASQWYMSFDHMATEDELPSFDVDGVTEISAEGNAPVRYFDVAGREVAAPVRGQLLITSDRRKVVF